MKISRIIEIISQYNILSLSDCQGSCPCGKCYIAGIEIEFHCWRGNCNDCKYSGLHIKQYHDCDYSEKDLKKIGEICLSQLKEIWCNTDWNLVIERDNDSISK